MIILFIIGIALLIFVILFIIGIALLIFGVFGGLFAFFTVREGLLVCSIVAFIVGLASIFGLTHITFGEQKLTGYVYAVEDGLFNKTTVHIRYSLNAGEDSQPSFCVTKADSEFVKSLAGSESKIEAVIPAAFEIGFSWDCNIPAKIKVINE